MKAQDEERRLRLNKTLTKYAIIFSLGIVYLLILLLIGRGLDCPIYKLTGLKCPGCGITRMLMALATLDFKAAFGYNPFLFIVGPLILAYLVYHEATYVIKGKPPSKVWNLPLTALLIATLAFGILRNVFNI